jgi:hypothetical protein
MCVHSAGPVLRRAGSGCQGGQRQRCRGARSSAAAGSRAVSTHAELRLTCTGCAGSCSAGCPRRRCACWSCAPGCRRAAPLPLLLLTTPARASPPRALVWATQATLRGRFRSATRHNKYRPATSPRVPALCRCRHCVAAADRNTRAHAAHAPHAAAMGAGADGRAPATLPDKLVMVCAKRPFREPACVGCSAVSLPLDCELLRFLGVSWQRRHFARRPTASTRAVASFACWWRRCCDVLRRCRDGCAGWR